MDSPQRATTPVDLIVGRLKRVKSNAGGFVALCPAHEDANASLSVSRGRDGRCLVKCHAGCTPEQVVGALGLAMTDLFVPEAPRANGSAPLPGPRNRPKLVKSYDYTDADGTLLFQACRFEPKTFRQRRKAPDGTWIWSLGEITPVLYRLPEVITAVAEGRQIFIVEGEKDADFLAEQRYPTTTSPMGAGKWRESYSDVLSGANVVILPDNDEPGAKHAQDVATSLHAKGCVVRVVALPGLPDKGDVSDWFGQGADLDDLAEIIGKTPRWSPDGADQSRRTRWRLDELWENDSIMRPPPPIVPRLAWAGRSTLLAAREKSGKSTLVGYIAAMVSSGGRFLGDPCEKGDVLLVGLEENPGDAARRLRHFGADATRMHLVTHFLGDPRERPQELMRHVDAVDPILVLVDSLSAWSDGQIQDDNNATQMTAVLKPLSDLAHLRGIAVVVIHHARKSDGRSRGSTAITAGTDVVCEFFPPDEDADPTLRRMRSAGRVPLVRQYDMRFSGDTYELAESSEAPLESRIITTVMSRPGISLADLVDALRTRRESVSRAVTDMLAKRMLVNTADGTTRLKLIVPAAAQPGFLSDEKSRFP